MPDWWIDANSTSARRRNASAVPLPWWTSQSRIEHAPGAQLGDREGGGERDVVEQAEPHRAVGFGVMTGGTYGAEPERRLAGHQRTRHLERAAGGMERGAKGGLADERVPIDRAAAGERQLPDPLDVTSGMDEL